MSQIIILMIRGYQKFLSPMRMNACRFYPTCSEYMVDAIRKYGAVGGVYRGVRRIMRCHPLHPGGYDPA